MIISYGVIPDCYHLYFSLHVSVNFPQKEATHAFALDYVA